MCKALFLIVAELISERYGLNSTKSLLANSNGLSPHNPFNNKSVDATYKGTATHRSVPRCTSGHLYHIRQDFSVTTNV